MVIGLIPARGGSKSFPDKNIQLLGGKPLIAHAIECGLASPSIDKLIVSTDSDKIAKISLEYGADVPFIRPENLAQDDSPMLPVLEHAIIEIENADKIEVECIVLLEPTGPLRRVKDIEGAMKIFRSKDCDAVVSGNESQNHPAFKMITKEDEYYKLYSDSRITRRQDTPKAYDLKPIVWIYSRNAIMVEKSRLPKKTLLYEIQPNRGIDIDTEFDFKIAEFILNLED